MKKQQKTLRNNQKRKRLGFQTWDVRKVRLKEQANIRKGKSKKKKIKKNKNNSVSKVGSMDKKQRNKGVLKGKTKGKLKKKTE